MTYLRPTSYRDVMLRTVSENDSELLYQVFVSSRADLFTAVADWDEIQQDEFIHFQFKAQQDQYRNHYADARFDVIVANSKVIGNLYIALVDEEIRLVDVTLLPEYRNRGIGHALVQDLLDEGARLQKNVTLHVQQENPAVHLYERMGFIETGEQGIYNCMAWQPSSISIA